MWLVLIKSQLCVKSAEHYTGTPMGTVNVF